MDNEQMQNPTDASAAEENFGGGSLLTGGAETDNAGRDGGGQTGQPSAGQERKGEALGREAAKTPAPEVPDTYELTMPEGVELDAALLEKATPLFKELKLSGEQAQKLSDLYADKLAEGRKAQLDAWNGLLDGWRSAAKSDPEIGGTKFAENVGAAKTALDRFGTPELKKALDEYGMGNHPELIRFCCRVGKALGEDRLVDGKPGGGSVDPAKVLYPGMN